MSVNGTGLVSWAYTVPSGASFEHYGVKWRPASGSSWTTHQLYSASAASYQLSNLTPGTRYAVQVYAVYEQDGLEHTDTSAVWQLTAPAPTATPAATATVTPTVLPVPTPAMSVTNTGYVTWSYTPPAGITSVSYLVQWNSHNHIVRNTNSFQIFSHQWVPGQSYAVYVVAMYVQGGDVKQIKSNTQTITVPGTGQPTATPLPTATPVPTPAMSVTNTGYVTWTFTPPAGVTSVSYIVQYNQSNHLVKNVNSHQIHDLTPGQTYAVYVVALYNHPGTILNQLNSNTQTITVPLPTATPTPTPTPTLTPTPTPPAAGAPGTVSIGCDQPGPRVLGVHATGWDHVGQLRGAVEQRQPPRREREQLPDSEVGRRGRATPSTSPPCTCRTMT